jgi:hypothetical protein
MNQSRTFKVLHDERLVRLIAELQLLRDSAHDAAATTQETCVNTDPADAHQRQRISLDLT